MVSKNIEIFMKQIEYFDKIDVLYKLYNTEFDVDCDLLNDAEVKNLHL